MNRLQRLFVVLLIVLFAAVAFIGGYFVGEAVSRDVCSCAENAPTIVFDDCVNDIPRILELDRQNQS